MNKTAAIYARVSTDRQKNQETIASQTTGLLEYAQANQYTIPPEWRFEDEGYSGSTLVRPALERLRDLIAEGVIETVLVYGPDRLSRNYAYQVLLLEEFARHGTEVKFLKAPAADTPEQRLLVQFQGMIAEYERAQIAERTRRGKRYRAKAGVINVLSSSAPYGYRYVKKTETAQAYYEVVEAEAEVIRRIFNLYTVAGRSIRSIVGILNAEKVPTRSRRAAWVNSTLWHMLRNPAYEGRACYGKTEPGPPSQRPNRIRRLRGAKARLGPVHRPRPPEDWISIAVPALVGKETFGLAQERLRVNKELSARRTKQPSVLQGLLVCEHCGYALCRVNTGSGQKLYHYYRCQGLDHYQNGQRVCNAGPVPIPILDDLVWDQVWQLLNEPELIEREIERRLQEFRQSSPAEQRQANVSRELGRLAEQTDKLIDAYQEGLMQLPELRQRIPELKKRQLALEKELESLNMQVLEGTRLAEINHSMERLVEQLKQSAQNISVEQKQRIVRLMVREVVVGLDHITIHHSIHLSGQTDGQKMPGYRLCTSRQPVSTQWGRAIFHVGTVNHL
jgi:site-specific DNA recombinase